MVGHFGYFTVNGHASGRASRIFPSPQLFGHSSGIPKFLDLSLHLMYMLAIFLSSVWIIVRQVNGVSETFNSRSEHGIGGFTNTLLTD